MALVMYGRLVSVRTLRTFLLSFSDTGTVPPERCLFGVMLNIAAVLGK